MNLLNTYSNCVASGSASRKRTKLFAVIVLAGLGMIGISQAQQQLPIILNNGGWLTLGTNAGPSINYGK